MKRIFVAVDISEESRERAALYINNLRKEFSNLRVGWEKPEKLHITLKFLGEISEKQIEDLKIVMGNTVSKITQTFSFDSAYRIVISDTGVFPNQKKARVLWLGLHDETEVLQKINGVLESECKIKGFVEEKRKFSPHLTIARLREPFYSQQLVEKHLENEFEPVAFEFSEIVIYESKLKPTGSIYEKFVSFKVR